MSDESMKMCEWFESLIEDLINEYKSAHEYYDWETHWNAGAVAALQELLKRLNE